MELNELISKLRDISNMRSVSHFKRTICKMAAQRLEAQQARITQLEAELKEEMYRHDRVQDFEVAEAQELAKLRQERRWIPVEERTPDVTSWSEAVEEEQLLRFYKSIPVFASCGDKCGMAEYHECRTVLGSGEEVDIEGCWIMGDGGVCVKYWRPMPEPPEEVG